MCRHHLAALAPNTYALHAPNNNNSCYISHLSPLFKVYELEVNNSSENSRSLLGAPSFQVFVQWETRMVCQSTEIVAEFQMLTKFFYGFNATYLENRCARNRLA